MLPVNVDPTDAVPEMEGTTVLIGSVPTPPVERVQMVAVPAEFVAVTFTST
jgi:hypothetical protein